MENFRHTPVTHHSHQAIFVFADLATCTHILVRDDTVRPSLQKPYYGPFPVISRDDKTITVLINDISTNISIDRVKPAYALNSVPDTPPLTPPPTPLLLLHPRESKNKCDSLSRPPTSQSESSVCAPKILKSEDKTSPPIQELPLRFPEFCNTSNHTHFQESLPLCKPFTTQEDETLAFAKSEKLPLLSPFFDLQGEKSPRTLAPGQLSLSRSLCIYSQLAVRTKVGKRLDKRKIPADSPSAPRMVNVSTSKEPQPTRSLSNRPYTRRRNYLVRAKRTKND